MHISSDVERYDDVKHNIIQCQCVYTVRVPTSYILSNITFTKREKKKTLRNEAKRNGNDIKEKGQSRVSVVRFVFSCPSRTHNPSDADWVCAPPFVLHQRYTWQLGTTEKSNYSFLTKYIINFHNDKYIWNFIRFVSSTFKHERRLSPRSLTVIPCVHCIRIRLIVVLHLSSDTREFRQTTRSHTHTHEHWTHKLLHHLLYHFSATIFSLLLLPLRISSQFIVCLVRCIRKPQARTNAKRLIYAFIITLYDKLANGLKRLTI